MSDSISNTELLASLSMPVLPERDTYQYGYKFAHYLTNIDTPLAKPTNWAPETLRGFDEACKEIAMLKLLTGEIEP